MPVTLTVAPPATGLVGAWGFDERVGRQVLDASGAGNPGTLSGATRTRGRFGGGLWFDGRNDWVTVAGDRSLDLSSGITLAAWVRPLARGRTVVVKESRQPALVRALRAPERARVHHRRARPARPRR